MGKELRFEVTINSDLDSDVEGVVAFGDFTSPKGTAVIYPDSGESLTSFYADLILGRPFPLSLVMRKVGSVGKLVAVALFLHRDLALHPKMLALVAATDLVDRFQVGGLAHVEPDLARFFKFITAYIPPDLSLTQQKSRLVTVVAWIREYVLEDRLPSLPPATPDPVIFDVGTNGFVLAEARSSLEDAWIELYRKGYLRGAVFSSDKDGRRTVLAARKSHFLAFNLKRAAEVLNEAEAAMGEPPGWTVNGLWLTGPERGTFLPVSAVTKVLIRV